jgi:hypothetical protein
MGKLEFAKAITEQDLGVTASSVMSDCYKYGMTYGCDVECPVLKSGNCELQDTDNKELYKEAIKNER